MVDLDDDLRAVHKYFLSLASKKKKKRRKGHKRHNQPYRCEILGKMGLLFINQCALVWTGLWPIFSILRLRVLNVLMASLYQQMLKGGKVKRSTQ